ISYDSYFPAIHGGAGIYISDDYAGGIMNETRGGISYAYYLQAGRELYLYGGLSASLFNRAFNFENAVLPDQIDATGSISLPSSETLVNENRTVFDVGTGFMAIYGRYSGGFAITHLTQPDLAGNGSSSDRLKRKYIFHFMADFDLNRQAGIKIRPIGSLLIQGTSITGFAGAVLEINSLAFNSGVLAGNSRNIDIQTGFSLRKERIAFFYNYRFNVVSENTMMPFSLIHQTGLTLTLNNLNNVKKRINFRTINMPLL
ncbi:MAG: type IX secretion system membrane protein PorP/SprF, partial [Bacteroidota bacterium]|nr:type IX secretion system membrane protein PorP/SprF [Bacteroidota bacterium]